MVSGFRFQVSGFRLFPAVCLLLTAYSRPVSLLTLSDGGVIDANGDQRFFGLSRGPVDRICHLQSCDDASKGRELSVQMWPVANQNKEVRGGALRLVAAGHGNDSAHVTKIARLIGQVMRHSFGELGTPFFAGLK